MQHVDHGSGIRRQTRFNCPSELCREVNAENGGLSRPVSVRTEKGACATDFCRPVYSLGMTRTVSLCLAVLLAPFSAGAADKMTKETFVSGGQTRTYYLLVPQAAKKAAPAPLLV